VSPPDRAHPRPIDPLAPGQAGRYVDDAVVVERRPRTSSGAASGSVRTEHFDVRVDGGRLTVVHDLPADAIDNDLGGLLARELFAPGWVSGAEVFERLMTGLVRSSRTDPLSGWELFYRNTLDRLRDADAALPRPGAPPTHGSIDDFAHVYRRAAGLARGTSVLELGCCFGFLSLLLDAAGHAVTATDVNPGTVRLLRAVAPRLGARLDVHRVDATGVRLPGSAFDTVLAIHLLEHLDAAEGEVMVEEALRLAQRRVIIAVPLEAVPDETYGHRRAFDLEALRDVGAATGWPFEVADHHGGWLVLDRVSHASGGRGRAAADW
jgi:SAM-dependent methyltransferase